jgi:hypothetical protein
VLTQLARIEGLRGNFDRGEQLIAEAEALPQSTASRPRVLLERGRLRHSRRNPAAALPLFQQAFAGALEARKPSQPTRLTWPL